MNKIGHALHELNEIFKKVTFTDRIKNILKNINFVDPVIVQSMIIFKNPKVGSEVTAHKDAEFLFTQPEIKLVGFWFALEDVTLENGCLWFIPKSHGQSVTRRFVRTYEDSEIKVSFNAPETEYDKSLFKPVTVPKGSLLLIHGLVVHKSGPNQSNLPRPVYTFHVIDQFETKWSPDNWLQPTEHLPFPKVY